MDENSYRRERRKRFLEDLIVPKVRPEAGDAGNALENLPYDQWSDEDKKTYYETYLMQQARDSIEDDRGFTREDIDLYDVLKNQADKNRKFKILENLKR